MTEGPVAFDDVTAVFPGTAATPVVRAAFDVARERLPVFLFNHVVRSWVFAIGVGMMEGLPFDREIVGVSTLLHDQGLVTWRDSAYRFEVDGANAARAFACEHGFDARRAQLVWDSIALHTIQDVAPYKETEVALAARGIGADFGRAGFGAFSEEEIDRILLVAPRLGMKQKWKSCLCQIAAERPEHNHNNVVGAFGERFVPGYRAPSVVDLMMNAPFSE